MSLGTWPMMAFVFPPIIKANTHMAIRSLCHPKHYVIWILIHLIFSSVQFFGHKACGILAPQLRIESKPPVLESKVLTTGLPGRSLGQFVLRRGLCQAGTAGLTSSPTERPRSLRPTWPPASLKSSRYLTPPKPRLQKWFLWLQSLLLLYILKRRSSKDLPVREPLWSPVETVSNGLVIHQMKETTEMQIIGIKWERRTSEDQL